MTAENGINKAYICTGCGIGECLDVEKLINVPVQEKFATEEAVQHSFLCSPEGINQIKGDVGEGPGKVVIAACSPRVFTDRFNFGPQVMVERVNFREGVAWVSEPNNEDTQMLAEDLLRMGSVKMKKSALPEPFIETLDRKILVIGGGITGMTAALEAARAGTDVVLVEKEAQLGGFLGTLKKRFPTGDVLEPIDTGIPEKIAAVEGESKIKVHLSSTVEKISGQPGMFDVSIKNGSSSADVRVGAIVQATGLKPYDAEKLTDLGYGKKNVVTNFQLEEMSKSGKITRPSDGKEVKNVAFIQCAGSRDENHLPYCSSFCCMTSLKQAAYLREQDPNVNTFIIYKDMRTPGKYELFYRKMQDDEGVFLTKGEVVSVDQGEGDSVTITVNNTLIGENIELNVDMAVLATGMQSASTNGENVLNLQYRQGPELPELADGFPDSHFICFPYETRRTGIYAAGPVRRSMDGNQAEKDAAGAALKAIQCIELSSQGKAVHPRSGDTSYPDIDFGRCTQCKRCTEECPYGMYDEDEKGTPQINPLRCRRCATCMGACPQKIISFKDLSIDQVGSMIKCCSMPGEEEGKPRILVLACINDAIPAFDMAGLKHQKLNPHIRVISVRCLGSVSLVWLSDTFSAGYDGILVMGCKFGDDYQCHNVKGSQLASERMSKLDETLGKMMIEPERVQLHQITMNDFDRLPQLINEFAEFIESVGPNPFKEFAV